MTGRIAVLAFGAIFGLTLGWARATDYDQIHAMLKLEDLHLFLVMGSAMATAAAGIALLRWRQTRSIVGGGLIAIRRLKPRGEHVLGSVLFGLGWAVAGTCPGPVAAQLGRGQLAGIFTVAGLFAGIAAARRLRAVAADPVGECEPATAGL